MEVHAPTFGGERTGTYTERNRAAVQQNHAVAARFGA
jgi:hypothetical protein